MKQSRIQVAPFLLIVGGGALTTECYLPALCRLGWEDQVTVIDSSQAVIAKIKNQYSSVKTKIGDYAAILKDHEFVAQFDGVVIALPNRFHEEAVMLSMEAGLDVLCEKPLAMDVDTCLRLATVSEERGRNLVVGMVRRFIPSIVAIRAAIQARLVGDVVEVSVEHGGAFHWPAQSGSYFQRENGGLFLNMGVHYLDMLESWLGALEPVEYADDRSGGVEANCVVALTSRDGARVNVRLSYTHELGNFIHVRGTRGELKSDVAEFTTVTWTSYEAGLVGQLQPNGIPADGTRSPDFISSFADQFLHFGEVITGRSNPAVSARQAAATQRIIEWAYQHRVPLHKSSASRSRARPCLDPAQAVVTGGSGFLGISLVERLSELGFQDIVVPVRSHQSGANVSRFPVNRVLTDLLDQGSVRAAVAGAKYLFHLAYGATGNDAARVTLEGTRNVVDAAIEAGVESLVVVSTATVFGHPKSERPIDETFPYRPALGDYGTSKAAAEKYALERAKSSGRTRITVINPSAIYGPNGRIFTEFPIRETIANRFAWIEGGRGKLNYTFVENVVDALVLAVDCKEAHGENFIINDGVCTFRQFFTSLLGSIADQLPSYTKSELTEWERRSQPRWRDLARALMNDEVMHAINGIPVLGRPKNIIATRFADLYARMQSGRRTLREDGRLERRQNQQQPRPPAWIADIFGPIEVEYSSAKAKRILGWQPLVSLEAGTSVSVDWLQAMHILPRKSFG